eukprot:6413038-Alexandrium_andersonii.AAC.3
MQVLRMTTNPSRRRIFCNVEETSKVRWALAKSCSSLQAEDLLHCMSSPQARAIRTAMLVFSKADWSKLQCRLAEQNTTSWTVSPQTFGCVSHYLHFAAREDMHPEAHVGLSELPSVAHF